MRSICIRTLASLALLATAAVKAGAGPDYQFERYWPAIQQPWYFRDSAAFVGPDGFVYVAESAQRAVRKFSRDGQLVSVFEPPGGLPKAIDFDAEGHVYVAMQSGDGVVKYTASGQRLRSFDNPGFGLAGDIAVTPDRAFVADFAVNAGAPPGSAVVHEFDLDGHFIRSWNNIGPGVGELDSAVSIAWHPLHGVTVADSDRDYLQRFDTDGNFLGTVPFNRTVNSVVQRIRFGSDGKLYMARGTDGDIFDSDLTPLAPLPFANGLLSEISFYFAISPFDDGNLLVSDLGRSALDIVTPSGAILSQYTAQSDADGRFFAPDDVAVDDNFIYVLETFVNTRLQQFDRQGQYIRTIGEGVFGFPMGIALDADGHVHVTDRFDNAIYEFDSQGNLLTTHSVGFNEPFHLDIDSSGNRVVTYYSLGGNSAQVEIISPAGVQLDTWTVRDGFDDQIANLHIVPGDIIWMLTREFESTGPGTGMLSNLEVARYDLAGNRLSGWSTTQFFNAITVNTDGEILLGGSGPIQIYDQLGNLLRQSGERGFQAGGFLFQSGLALGSDDRLVAVDATNHRVQIFAGQLPAVDTRAIIVAGGGPYPGNALWPATELNANFAYRTLVFQGLDKDAIQYLSDNTALDVDQNGQADDVDAVASNAALREAILGPSGGGTDGFSAGTGHLVVYLVDHGGLENFRISGTETTTSGDFTSWVDTWQAANPGSRLTVIYDACQSGSFLDNVSNPDFSPRHVMTSSQPDENAYFVSQGTLSFSNHFWTHIFNGLSVGQAYDLASTSTSSTFPDQTPLLDADGDGLPNTPADNAEIAALVIGNGTSSTGSRPVIGGVDTGIQPISSGNSATVTATNVTDGDGIARVWAVLRPPNFNPGSPDNPIQDLPTFELLPVGGGSYAGTYDRFDDIGTYQLTINALDSLGNSAVPVAAQVTIQSPLKRRAVVIAGGAAGDPALPRNQALAELAVQGLVQQGYGGDGASCQTTACDDVQFLIDAGVVGQDGTPLLANIQPAITTWGSDGVQDLTVYLVGERESGGIRLTGGEVLTVVDLDSWLTTARASIPGVLTLVVDTDDAGGLIRQLTSATDQILVAGSGQDREAVFIDQGAISFSRFFWSQVLNGSNVGAAFSLARAALNFSASGPGPEIDANGNGTPNELFDGPAARRYTIGTGVLLAGDEPLIGSLTVADPVVDGDEAITIENVTSTGTVVSAIAVTTQPDGRVVTDTLQPSASGFAIPQASGLCGGAGDYAVAVYAIDEEGLASQPALRTVNRPSDCIQVIFASSFE